LLFIFNSFAIGHLGMTWLCVILRPLRPTLMDGLGWFANPIVNSTRK
jgi:hypothetical protein